MQAILGAMRKAITDYNMIQDGDSVAVGVSGGKDSVALLVGLCRLKAFIGIDYRIVAITVDPQFDNIANDYSEIEKLCQKFGVEYIIRRSDLGNIIFSERAESNPCSLCARMRRGMLHDLAKDNGCNKIALGHHYNDVVETFVMNLANEGRIGCFQPVTYLSRKDITMIRPMVFIPEKEVERAIRREGLPITKSRCPVDGATERENIKIWLEQMEKGPYPGLTKRLFGALRRSGIDGW